MFSKTFTVSLLLLATANWVWAEGSGDEVNPSGLSPAELENEEKQSNFPQFPFFPNFGSMFSGSGFPSFPGFGGFNFPGLGGSRPERSIEAHDVGENDENEQQSRLFFNFPRIVNCNFTTQAGRTCLSCNQALTCNSNNVGILRACHGLFRHCNGGRCSLFQSSACSSGATTTATTTTTTAAPTTVAATTAAAGTTV